MKTRTYELFTAKYSVIVQAKTIMAAIMEFGHAGHSERIIEIRDLTFREEVRERENQAARKCPKCGGEIVVTSLGYHCSHNCGVEMIV